jgi:hypothetical protein
MEVKRSLVGGRDVFLMFRFPFLMCVRVFKKARIPAPITGTNEETDDLHEV